MFKNIMLAVDGSNYTDSVLSLGITLARAFHSHLQVLTVADIRVFEWATAIGSDGFVPITPTSLYQKESIRLLEEKCIKVLEKCNQILEKEKLDFEVEKMVSSPVNAIIERSQISDLVIMGKCGEFSRWERTQLGATVETVSRLIRKPVIITDKKHSPIQKILFGYDGSANANQAMLFVGHLGEKLNAAITVLTITDDQELGEHYLKEAEKYLKSYKVKIEFVLLPGTPDKEIIKYAENNNINLVAIGAYGHSRIREALLGSNTDYVLRYSPCHVLLAK
ncbi:universal stress protein [candidate division KSB1 bacterium]|nr:universal stress protein [candidate division KSB1 bacterium]